MPLKRQLPTSIYPLRSISASALAWLSSVARLPCASAVCCHVCRLEYSLSLARSLSRHTHAHTHTPHSNPADGVLALARSLSLAAHTHTHTHTHTNHTYTHTADGSREESFGVWHTPPHFPSSPSFSSPAAATPFADIIASPFGLPLLVFVLLY